MYSTLEMPSEDIILLYKTTDKLINRYEEEFMYLIEDDETDRLFELRGRLSFYRKIWLIATNELIMRGEFV